MTVLRDCFPSHLGEKADLTFGSLCTGYGGLDLGVATALGGGRLLWVADPDPHVSKVLATRMPDVPNLGDITTIDWQQVEPVDVLTAGFPCQDISAAGRRAGIRKGNRSGIWRQVVTAVRHLRPALLVVENVAALRWRHGGLDIVLGDLAEVGYDAQWTSVRASDIGAPHRRERVFLLAWPRVGVVDTGDGDAANADRARWCLQRHLGSQQTRRSLALGLVAVAADTTGFGRRGIGRAAWRPGVRRRPGAGLCGDVPADTGHERRPLVVVHAPSDQDSEPVHRKMSWDVYELAVRRWEQVLGRIAPFPTQPGRHGRPVLSPAFVEWLQGLAPGWVTAVEISRTAQLRALGNGVVPQQAEFAVRLMLADLLHLDMHDDEAQAA